MTASRARNSDIGSDRENSRIGGRPALLPEGLTPGPVSDFFRAMFDYPVPG
jgi:hypothetical protein